MRPLKALNINEKVYHDLIDTFPAKYEADLAPFQYGYKDKKVIRYNEDKLICLQAYLVALGLMPSNENDNWYQYSCFIMPEQKKEVSLGFKVVDARRKVEKVLHKHYTDTEIEAIFNSHSQPDSTILHLTPVSEEGKIQCYHNCYYYDINGAYASELIGLFPKCASDFAYMYKHRHDNNNRFKNVFNFYVGCLTMNEDKQKIREAKGEKLRPLHTGTRHYIVDRISQKMLDMIAKVGGDLIYINTDGFIVQNPSVIIPHSTELGEFKLEYQGDIYTYRDKNYIIFQYGDEIKGNMPLNLRDRVDLRKGKVIHYTKVKANENYFTYINIEEEVLEDGSKEEKF